MYDYMLVYGRKGEVIYYGLKDTPLINPLYIETPTLTLRTRDYDIYETTLTPAGEFLHYNGNP